jgi:hypothetical protein
MSNEQWKILGEGRWLTQTRHYKAAARQQKDKTACAVFSVMDAAQAAALTSAAPTGRVRPLRGRTARLGRPAVGGAHEKATREAPR